MHYLSCHVYIGSIVLYLALHHEKRQQRPPISPQREVRDPSVESDRDFSPVTECNLFHIG